MAASGCECDFYTWNGTYGYYICEDDLACDENKEACAVEACGGYESVYWEEVYCGNNMLQVACQSR